MLFVTYTTEYVESQTLRPYGHTLYVHGKNDNSWKDKMGRIMIFIEGGAEGRVANLPGPSVVRVQGLVLASCSNGADSYR